MKTIFLTLLFLICLLSASLAQVVGSSPCLTAYPSAPSQVIEASSSVNLLANPAPSGFEYRWYDSDGVSQVATSQTLSTPVLSTTKVYYLAYYHTSTACLTAKVPVRVIWNAEKKTVVKTYAVRDSLNTEAQVRAGNSVAISRVSQYYDSLGRSNQTVAIQASVNGQDIISFNTYDNYGRPMRDYLPFANNNSSPGLYRTNAASLHSTYYTSNFGDSRGFADKTYEASPLSRLTKQGVPGTPWIGKEIKLDENTNGSGDAVRIWTVDGAGLPVTASNYPAGALSKFETIDEDSRKVIEYKDKLGRLILKKVQEAGTPSVDHTGWLCTYYVYDSFGRLRVVMPPYAVVAIIGGGQSSTSTSIRDGLYYLYSYDERGRMITKKLPDKGTEEMVYDLQDRLVAWRDANLAGQNKWLYTKYDALGRMVLTGIVTYGSVVTRATLQSHVNTLGSNNAVLNSTSGRSGASNAGGYPQVGQGNGEGEVLSANFYDNYSLTNAGMTYIQRSGFDVQSSKTHGLLTGKLVTNLHTGTRMETVMFYDSHGRQIQTLEEHHLGGFRRFSSRYDFENKVLQTITEFTSSFGSNTMYRYFNYNSAGLLSSTTHQINASPTVTLANYTYNNLGELINKTFPVAGNAAMNFTYNIRGWIKKINDPQASNSSNKVFAQELFYESGGTSPQYNGNISKAEWRGQDDIKRVYNYFYDPNNRIKDALYTVPDYSWQDGRYNIGYVNYDPNGNITTLQRVNQQNSSIWALVDNLEYYYQSNSNKLLNVHDYQGTTSYLSKDFKNFGTTNYSYDVNGNLTANSDKDITSITYNHLNLPATITFSGSNRKIDYWYNSEGVKVRQVNTDGGTIKTIDYLSEFVYENNSLSYVIHEEGRATFENSAFQYEFFIKDHLGNVRQVVRAPVSALRIATMEPENAEKEEEEFKNIKESRQGASEHNKTPGGYATAWLNADRGRILGPSRTQEVQEGDSVELGVFGKYVDPKKVKLSPATFARTGMDRKIIRTLGEYGQNLAASPNEIAIANVIALVIGELQQKPAPEAYMGYALYDSDSVLYEQGKVILSKKARNKHEELIQKIAIKKDGYIETYLVNETAENVWFDQFRIMSTGPLIVQETHYDPWGVELSGLGYQYGGIKVNPYLYNGKEANGHLGVNMFDYGARMYDPAIGRWFVVDPLANHELQLDKSPYAYGWNNPIKYIDPNGLCPNGCSENEKSGEPYKDGAIVQNKYGTSQYVDGEWVTISSTPDGSGENTSTDESGGGGNGSGASSEGNGFFGSTGWGDMAGGALNGVGQLATFYGGMVSTKGFVKYNDNTWTGKNGKVYSQSSLYKDYYGKGGKYVRGVQGLRNSANAAFSQAQKLKALGRGVGTLSVAITTLNALDDGIISNGDIAKIGIGVLTITGPIGWGYGIIDISTQLLTGTSITDRTGNFIDKHW